MSFSFTETISLKTVSCAHCGVTFALTDSFIDFRRRNGESFYCPNGHSLTYDSEFERLKRTLEAERRKLAEADARLSQANTTIARERDARANAEKKHKRKMRRITNGVCPCCNRTFTDLGRHMKSKHPKEVIPATKPI